MVLRSATLLVAAGLVIGGVGAWFLSSTAKAFLFRMDVTDPRAVRRGDWRAGRGRADCQRDSRPGARPASIRYRFEV